MYLFLYIFAYVCHDCGIFVLCILLAFGAQVIERQ